MGGSGYYTSAYLMDVVATWTHSHDSDTPSQLLPNSAEMHTCSRFHKTGQDSEYAWR